MLNIFIMLILRDKNNMNAFLINGFSKSQSKCSCVREVQPFIGKAYIKTAFCH